MNDGLDVFVRLPPLPLLGELLEAVRAETRFEEKEHRGGGARTYHPPTPVTPPQAELVPA